MLTLTWGKVLALILLVAALIYLLLLRQHWSRKLSEAGEGAEPEASIILSLRNQEGIVEGLIRDLIRVADLRLSSFQLVVVDLGSRDDTVPILSRLVEEYPCMEVICLGEKVNFVLPEMVAYPFCRGRTIYHLAWAPGNHPRKTAWKTIRLSTLALRIFR